jgi:hypothetical protein
MGKETVGLKIDIDSDSIRDAARRSEDLAKASERIGTKTGDAITKTQGLATKASSLATKAGVAVAAVAALGGGILAMAAQARDAARELNQGLLDAIEDTARGSEDATEQFEDLENAMRNIRGQSDLLSRGYGSLEEATEAATEEFAKNEAIVRDLDRIIPRFKEGITNLAFDAYRSLRGEVLEVNEALIQQQIEIEASIRSLERLSDEFGGGFGVERVGAVLDNLDTANEHVRRGFELLAAEMGEATDQELMFLSTTGSLNSELSAVAANMVRTGQMTEGAANAMLSYANTERGRGDVMLMLQGFLEENDELERQLADSRSESTSVTREATETVESYGTAITAMGGAYEIAIGRMSDFAVKTRDIMEAAALAEKEATRTAEEGATKRAQALKDELDLKAEALAEFERQNAEQAAGGFDVTTQSVGALTSAFSGLDISGAIFKDGELGLKEMSKQLGDTLVNLGAFALAYAAVVALGTAIPALGALLGTPASAPVLAAAGAGAIAVGVGLGAAGRSGRGGGADPGVQAPATQTVETSRTSIYNVTLGAGMPARGMNRALLEQVGSAVGQGV